MFSVLLLNILLYYMIAPPPQNTYVTTYSEIELLHNITCLEGGGRRHKMFLKNTGIFHGLNKHAGLVPLK
jgi:hypothetical protein